MLLCVPVLRPYVCDWMCVCLYVCASLSVPVCVCICAFVCPCVYVSACGCTYLRVCMIPSVLAFVCVLLYYVDVR